MTSRYDSKVVMCAFRQKTLMTIIKPGIISGKVVIHFKMTSSENRTLEFLNVVKSLPPQDGSKSGAQQLQRFHQRPVHHSHAGGAGGTATTSVGAATAELRTFHQQASEISRDITSTSTLMRSEERRVGNECRP